MATRNLPYLVLIVLMCASCATQKYKGKYDLKAPEMDSISETAILEQSEGKEIEISRKTFIKDDLLNEIIDSVLVKNYKLLMAVENIRIFEEQVKESKMANIPNFNLEIGASRNYFSDNSLNGSQGFDLEQSLGNSYVDDYLAAIHLDWQPDIWLGNKNKKKAAIARFLQEKEILRLLKIELIEKTAKTYYNILLLNSKLEIAEKSLSLNDTIYNTVKTIKEYGNGNELEVQQAALRVLEVETLLNTLKNERFLWNNALTALLADSKHKFMIEGNILDLEVNNTLSLEQLNQLIILNPKVKAGIYRYEEQQFESMVANSNRYPNLNLGLSSGINSFKSGNWLSFPESFFGVLATSLSAPLLNGRKLKTDYNISKIEVDKAILSLNDDLLNTSLAVSNNLETYNTLQNNFIKNRERLNILKSAVENALLLYQEGETDYLQVFLIQQDYLDVQLEHINTQQKILETYIDIYTEIGFKI